MRSPKRFAVNASAASAAMPANASLAKLLVSHILRDGEVVVLILRPSLWFIFFNSLRFIVGGIVLILAARLLSHQGHAAAVRGFVEAGVSAICGRLMWSTVQWTSRLYILTDMRVLSLSGVFNVDIFDCPLRKVANTALNQSVRDRLIGVGSIRIIAQSPEGPVGEWQTVAHPVAVHEQMLAAISRAKQGGGLSD